MTYITNVTEAQELLKTKLSDYLVALKLIKPGETKLRCFAHEERTPSMKIDPKKNFLKVFCFGCGWCGDIFDVAAKVENKPIRGELYYTETLPYLGELLGVPIKLGEVTEEDRQRHELYRAYADMASILEVDGTEHPYVEQRSWKQEHIPFLSIKEEDVFNAMLAKGWDSLWLRSNTYEFAPFSKSKPIFSEENITLAIRDARSRPIGFISRSLKQKSEAKYMNSSESLIYKKAETLLGLDIALKSDAKKNGLYIVEGPGDLIQLYRHGITNAVAICGVALTAKHLVTIKSYGISKIYMWLDWDNAGRKATERIISNVLSSVSGISLYVVDPGQEVLEDIKDPDEFLLKYGDEAKQNIEILSSFDWQLGQLSFDNLSPEEICKIMIPTIASEESAVRRDLLIRTMENYTGISRLAILTDVNSIRDATNLRMKTELISMAEDYLLSVKESPDDIRGIHSSFEKRIEEVESKYKRYSIGINHQIERFKALEKARETSSLDEFGSGFRMNRFSNFAEAMSGGLSWAAGCLIYVGGRANSGKTATVLAFGVDIAMSDPNAVVLIHCTDDAYEQIEPRLRSNLFEYTRVAQETLSIGMIVQPNLYLPKEETYWKMYKQASDLMYSLIESERLVIIDSEDGKTMSLLEKQVRYYRQKFPGKKICVVCDNTHNYTDHSELDSTRRVSLISEHQKDITTKYQCLMIATAEYRKNMPMNRAEMKLPVDDDLADARALMYKPNVIMHVYNDIHDREDGAEIFWTKDGHRYPRLLLCITKNKISSFKDKLVLDLDPVTVSLKARTAEEARREVLSLRREKNLAKVEVTQEASEYE